MDKASEIYKFFSEFKHVYVRNNGNKMDNQKVQNTLALLNQIQQI